MANTKITQLDDADLPLTGEELIEIVQGGVNKKAPQSAVSGGGGGSTPSLGQVLAVRDRDVTEAIDGNILFEDGVETLLVVTNTLGVDTNIIVPQSGAPFGSEYKILNNSGFVLTLVPDTDVTLIGDVLQIPENAIACVKEISANTYSVTYQTNSVGGGGSSWIVISANHTAVNDEQYSNVANATYTDPSPVEGKGYEVKVVNGTATIGGVGFTEGMIVTRTFHSGSWRTKSYVDQTIIGTATQTALDEKADLTQVGNLIREDFTFGLSQTFTLANNYGQVYSVEVQGQGALSTSQYTLVAPNQVTINDTLNAGDYVVIIYSNAINGVQPYYSQAETDALVDNVAILKSVGATYTTNAILTVTQAEYDALTPEPTTLYVIL